MARILHSDDAPSEAVHYSFAGVEFDLGGSNKGSFETDDPIALLNAESHPWLKVEREEAVLLQGKYRDQLDPRKDPLSIFNSVANDPEAVRKAAEERDEAVIDQLAIDAGLDQKEPVSIGPVDETLAAHDSSKTAQKQQKAAEKENN